MYETECLAAQRRLDHRSLVLRLRQVRYKRCETHTRTAVQH